MQKNCFFNKLAVSVDRMILSQTTSLTNLRKEKHQSSNSNPLPLTTDKFIKAQVLTLAYENWTLRSRMGKNYRITLLCVDMEWMTTMKCRSLGLKMRRAEVHGHYTLCKNILVCNIMTGFRVERKTIGEILCLIVRKWVSRKLKDERESRRL